ncbi:MAG: hypothetical protein ABSD38_20195 [Syntrophorhabdales bacterium]|jgi:hypothetical protein
MTADTTFKEFVEEEGLTLSLLEVDSLQYRNLVERFNEVKVKLRAQEGDRLHERARLVLILNGQSVREDLRSLPAGS